MTSPLPRRAASAGLRMQSGGLSAEQALRLALKRSLEDAPAAAAAPEKKKRKAEHCPSSSSSSSASSSSAAPAPVPAVAAAAQKKPRKAGSSSAPAMDSATVARLCAAATENGEKEKEV